MNPIPGPNFDHLLRMTDGRGTFEHARFREPRPVHGYCTDDMARVLVVTAREPDPTDRVRDLAGLSLRFLSDALGVDGGLHNRMGPRGRWEDHPGTGDWWGRGIWGLGTAAAHLEGPMRRLAVAQLDGPLQARSVWPRAMAFAVIGAAELLSVQPSHRSARQLLIDATARLPAPRVDPSWPWPEPRLTYANAVLPEAMIAAGVALDQTTVLDQGLELLAWLLAHETREGHLSVTPVGGSGPNDAKPAFDQQPIEIAALADACARAMVVDGATRWADGVGSAAAWFLGDNDAGTVMWDADGGGGYDGLRSDGANLNQGTESSLAVLSTFQHAQRLALAFR